MGQTSGWTRTAVKGELNRKETGEKTQVDKFFYVNCGKANLGGDV